MTQDTNQQHKEKMVRLNEIKDKQLAEANIDFHRIEQLVMNSELEPK